MRVDRQEREDAKGNSALRAIPFTCGVSSTGYGNHYTNELDSPSHFVLRSLLNRFPVNLAVFRDELEILHLSTLIDKR